MGWPSLGCGGGGGEVDSGRVALERRSRHNDEARAGRAGALPAKRVAVRQGTREVQRASGAGMAGRRRRFSSPPPPWRPAGRHDESAADSGRTRVRVCPTVRASLVFPVHQAEVLSPKMAAGTALPQTPLAGRCADRSYLQSNDGCSSRCAQRPPPHLCHRRMLT